MLSLDHFIYDCLPFSCPCVLQNAIFVEKSKSQDQEVNAAFSPLTFQVSSSFLSLLKHTLFLLNHIPSDQLQPCGIQPCPLPAEDPSRTAISCLLNTNCMPALYTEERAANQNRQRAYSSHRQHISEFRARCTGQ